VIGALVTILVMAAFCVSPVPAELWLIANVQMFGALIGFFYSWLGILIGAIILFAISRLLRSRWSADSGAFKWLRVLSSGSRRNHIVYLLLARILPVPFKLVNIAAGASKTVRVFDFLWTTALGVLPYNIATVLLFLGVLKNGHGLRNLYVLIALLVFVYAIYKLLTVWLAKRRKATRIE